VVKFKVMHPLVFLCYEPRHHILAFVSGVSFSRARERLIADDSCWEGLKTFIACFPVGVLDYTKLLDTTPIDEPIHFIADKTTPIRKHRNGETE